MAKPVLSAPQFVKYVGPVLDALQQLGGSGRPDEVRSVIAERLKLSEEEQSEPLPSKAQPRFDNQVHWARFYLSTGGYIDGFKRGVWALTEKGRHPQTTLHRRRMIHLRFRSQTEAKLHRSCRPCREARSSVFASGCFENPDFRKCQLLVGLVMGASTGSASFR